MSQVSDGKVERTPRARLLLGFVLCVENNRSKVSPLSGVPCPPFYRPRGAGVIEGRKRKKPKVEKVLRGNRVFLFSCVCPANMADRVKDGVFADPYRVMPWLLSASGCIPSFAGGLCGVSEGQAMTLRGVAREVTLRPSL